MKVDFGSGCSGILPAVVATTALLLSTLSNFWCQSVKFDPVAVDNLATFHFGLFMHSRMSSVEVNWKDAQISTKQECATYSSSIDFDDPWTAARAFAIIVSVIGPIVMMLLWMVPCVSTYRWFTENVWKAIAGILLVVLPLCQGLTLLILQSEVCRDNPVLEVLGAVGVYDDHCQLDVGGYLNIAGIILWFLAGLLMLVVGYPY